MAVSVMASEMGLRVLGIEKRIARRRVHERRMHPKQGAPANGPRPARGLALSRTSRSPRRRPRPSSSRSPGSPSTFGSSTRRRRARCSRRSTSSCAKGRHRSSTPRRRGRRPAASARSGSSSASDLVLPFRRSLGSARRRLPHERDPVLLDRLPESLVIIGGGAIGCEMAQAFGRLGTRVSIVHMDEHLLPHGDWEAGRLLEAVFAQEGIEVRNGSRIASVTSSGRASPCARTSARRCAASVSSSLPDGDSTSPSSARQRRIEFSERGLHVDRRSHDRPPHLGRRRCESALPFLSHAAMHQGMIALINSFLAGAASPPLPFLRRAVDGVHRAAGRPRRLAGARSARARHGLRGHRGEVRGLRRRDRGRQSPSAAFACMASASGRIYGVRIVGEGAGEMINEWGLAIQTAAAPAQRSSSSSTLPVDVVPVETRRRRLGDESDDVVSRPAHDPLGRVDASQPDPVR